MTSSFQPAGFHQGSPDRHGGRGHARGGASGRVIGANDRVRIGCIGVGYRGVQVLFAFGAHKDAEIVSLCDVYEPYLHGQFDQIDPHFKKLGYVVPVAAARLRRAGAAAQGLPPGPRPEGSRRGDRRHARSLARPA